MKNKYITITNRGKLITSKELRKAERLQKKGYKLITSGSYCILMELTVNTN